MSFTMQYTMLLSTKYNMPVVDVFSNITNLQEADRRQLEMLFSNRLQLVETRYLKGAASTGTCSTGTEEAEQ